jgi:uncharacterized protein YjiS (DUF1127 family)
MDAGWQALCNQPRGELLRLSDRQITDHLDQE